MELFEMSVWLNPVIENSLMEDESWTLNESLYILLLKSEI